MATAFYLWTEADFLKTRFKQDTIALQRARRELDQAQSQLTEKIRQLESTQTALEAATARAAQTRSALSTPSDSVQTATDLSSAGSSPFIKNIFALAQRAADLDRRFKYFPEYDIPEIELLTESDWIGIAAEHSKLDTTDQISKALKHVSALAESKALQHFQTALMKGTDPTLIDRIDALLPELRKKLPENVIQRYELVPWTQLETNASQREYFKKEQNFKPVFVIRSKTISEKLRQCMIASSSDGKSIDSIIFDSPGIVTEEGGTVTGFNSRRQGVACPEPAR